MNKEMNRDKMVREFGIALLAFGCGGLTTTAVIYQKLKNNNKQIKQYDDEIHNGIMEMREIVKQREKDRNEGLES